MICSQRIFPAPSGLEVCSLTLKFTQAQMMRCCEVNKLVLFFYLTVLSLSVPEPFCFNYLVFSRRENTITNQKVIFCLCKLLGNTLLGLKRQTIQYFFVRSFWSISKLQQLILFAQFL